MRKEGADENKREAIQIYSSLALFRMKYAEIHCQIVFIQSNNNRKKY